MSVDSPARAISEEVASICSHSVYFQILLPATSLSDVHCMEAGLRRKYTTRTDIEKQASTETVIQTGSVEMWKPQPSVPQAFPQHLA